MSLRAILGVAMAAIVVPAWAEPPRLAFTSAGPGLYEFNTGELKGRLKFDGKYQGLYPLIDVASGAELVHAPGVFSPYRVFTTGRRYGDAARDWPTTTRLSNDGAVEVHWPSAEGHPLEMTAIYRWTASDALDFDVSVKPQMPMPKFELFLSSYFAKGFLASVYAAGPDSSGEKGALVPVDRNPQSGGGYVMFPLDEAAIALVRDGRWRIPPSPVDWAIERRLAGALAIRRDKGLGLTAALMVSPEACFAVSCPWNPDGPDASGYRSLYFSLFGQDLRGGQTVHARCRLVLARELPDNAVITRYQEFLKKP